MILQHTIMPEQASDMAWHVDNVIWFITAVTGITGIGVYVAMLVFCIAYRRRTPNAIGPAWSCIRKAGRSTRRPAAARSSITWRTGRSPSDSSCI